MHRSLRTSIGLVGGIALTLSGAGPASAATWVNDDNTADVESFSWNDETEEEVGPTPAPESTDTDITRVSVKHQGRRVVLTTELVDITEQSGVMQYEVRTGARNFYIMQRLGTDRSFPGFMMMRGNGNPVRCSGLSRGVDRTLETSMVSIPRRCLDRPRWVRVGAGAVGFVETETSGAQFFDDGLRDGPAQELLALSPRVYRG